MAQNRKPVVEDCQGEAPRPAFGCGFWVFGFEFRVQGLGFRASVTCHSFEDGRFRVWCRGLEVRATRLRCLGPWGSGDLSRQRSGCRKVDVRLPGRGNSNSHDARPVHLIITKIKWTSRLSTHISLSWVRPALHPEAPAIQKPLSLRCPVLPERFVVCYLVIRVWR